MKKIKFDFGTVNKLLILVMMIVAIIMSTNYEPKGNEVLDSLGKYEYREFYSDNGFMDFMEYGKYYYSSVNTSENAYFKKISESNVEKLNILIDEFEQWLSCYNEDSCDLVVKYDFKRDLIDNEDYVYYETKYEKVGYNSEGEMFFSCEVLEVYYLDIQTNTVYYFHNKI